MFLSFFPVTKSTKKYKSVIDGLYNYLSQIIYSSWVSIETERLSFTGALFKTIKWYSPGLLKLIPVKQEAEPDSIVDLICIGKRNINQEFTHIDFYVPFLLYHQMIFNVHFHYRLFWKFINNLIFQCKIFSLSEKHAVRSSLYNESDNYRYLHSCDAQAGCHLEGIA